MFLLAFGVAAGGATTQPARPITVAQYLSGLSAAVQNRESSQADRDEAARRLVAADVPQSRAALASALTSTDERQQLAAARALGQSPYLDPAWVDPLARMLGRDRALTEAAAAALSQFDGNPRAYGPLADFARSRQPAAVRIAVARELGGVVEKPVAGTLLDILANPGEDPGVTSAAGEALQRLSGQAIAPTDIVRWRTWWGQRNGRALADWHAQVVAEQHAALARADQRTRDEFRQLQRHVADLLTDQYQRQPPADKPVLLLSFLQNPDPSIRQIGASLVQQAVSFGQPVTPDIHRRLIDLVGDASPDVRLAVAQALNSLADPEALGGMLVQLQLEPNADVAVALCRAVAKIPNARAAPVLVQLLSSPSPRVAAAAAAALKTLSPEIRRDPAESRRVFLNLQSALINRTGPAGQPNTDPASESLRATLLSAMAPLADRSNPGEAINFFTSLVRPDESSAVRAAAVEGLGALGDPAANSILAELDPNTEPDPAVRLAAATALGEVGSFAYAQQLDRYTQPQNEPSAEVRQRARLAFESLLPNASVRQLNDWAQVFKLRHDVAAQTDVLKILTDKLVKTGELESLAMQQQSLGELYLAQNQAAQAVPYLQQALDYWEHKQNQHGRTQTVDQLVAQLTRALLESRQYHDAATFAAKEIRQNEPNQEVVGPAVRDAADRLIQAGAKGDPNAYRDAAKLIREFMSLNPPLREDYQDSLRSLQSQIPGTGQG